MMVHDIKKLLAFAFGAVALTAAVQAAPLNQDAGEQKVTVAKAKTMWDDSWVTLEGTLDKKIGHERYQFRDATGTMPVEIDDEDWHGQVVNEGQKVRIHGEVDRHAVRQTEVDVDRVDILN
ncbi:NirD/YgiW/YdeI family stress tolerance protein [Stenoxybacter acetivorans]|uniref:NirD/YgiW/YdeI family stress tolerance protein n=1 Tax=Stenoxybacter acetivorans TaxID=422441 RepID=UPI000690737E|nr:NirD/YgiW/YdeI family stress tolerance protein [Stenoxybacter acetivorans]